MKLKLKTYSLEFIRLVLAFLFILASIEKLKNPFAFALSIDAYRIFPEFFVNMSVLIIPWLELFVGFGLLFNYKLRLNLFVYLFLMVTFTLLVVFAVIKGLDIECGCFGESSSKVGLKKIFENLLIILVNVILIRNFSVLKKNEISERE
ncbi:MAG: hypothetical protein N3F03_08630 [Ignavibacteria bacterium]|nr:hypothetical protein [Ignavibacteria bacterium]